MTLRDRRILLVEDEIIVAFALEDMMRDEGAEPVLASSLGDAQQTLAQERFDMAILDVNLNGLESYPVADILTEQHCPFIFATGYGSFAHPDRFRSVPTISKPYDLAAIKTALDRRARSAGQ